MGKEPNIVFYAEKSRLKTAPKSIAFLATFLWFALVVLGIALILSILSKSFMTAITISGIIVLVIVTLTLFNVCFEWFLDSKIAIYDSKIEYSFKEVISALGMSEVKETITEMSDFRVKGSKLEIYGIVKHVEPLRKVSIRNKAEILGRFQEMDKLLEALNNFKETVYEG